MTTQHEQKDKVAKYCWFCRVDRQGSTAVEGDFNSRLSSLVFLNIGAQSIRGKLQRSSP